MKNIFILWFFFLSFNTFSQKSEGSYIKEVRYKYAIGQFYSAKLILEEAFKYYPNSPELEKFKKYIEEDSDFMVKKPINLGNSGNTGGVKVEGGKTGTGGNSGGGKTGGTTVVEKDSDGDGFVDVKDKCPHEFGEINGCPDSDGDGVPDNSDNCPDVPGSITNKGCKSIKQVQYNFKMTEQNVFSWNPDIGKSGAKTILTIDNYSGGKKTYDVTGMSKFILITKDSKFDGVDCKITLTIQGDSELKLIGSNQLNETVTCSGNH